MKTLMPAHSPATLARYVKLSCLWEVTAPKAGNVHPHASFADCCYEDFVRSSEIVAPVISRANERGVSRTILDAVRITQDEVGKNTNLGIILLLAPLAAAAARGRIEKHITDVIDELTVQDSIAIVQAIRLAAPGGLGQADRQDVHSEPDINVRTLMSLAESRDHIARQYARDFADVLGFGVESIASWQQRFPSERDIVIVGSHLEWIARYTDTLISRKCGQEIGREVAMRAERILDLGWPESEDACRVFQDLDDWLRSDGNRLNPGTTADLIVASLFVALCEGQIQE